MCSIIQRCRQACLLSVVDAPVQDVACRMPHHPAPWLAAAPAYSLGRATAFPSSPATWPRWLTCCRQLTRVPLSSFPNRPCWRRMRGSCPQKQRATAEIGSCRDLFTGPELPRLAVSPRALLNKSPPAGAPDEPYGQPCGSNGARPALQLFSITPETAHSVGSRLLWQCLHGIRAKWSPVEFSAPNSLA
jgi:hypothetical protein